jgi:hypothetical protein
MNSRVPKTPLEKALLDAQIAVFSETVENVRERIDELIIERSKLIWKAREAGFMWEDIARFFGKNGANDVRSLVHSKTVRSVAELPSGYLTRVTLAAELGVQPHAIHRAVIEGELTDEVLFQNRSFIRVAA